MGAAQLSSKLPARGAPARNPPAPWTTPPFSAPVQRRKVGDLGGRATKDPKACPAMHASHVAGGAEKGGVVQGAGGLRAGAPRAGSLELS